MLGIVLPVSYTPVPVFEFLVEMEDKHSEISVVC
jgi:hypothetical protein